MKKIAAAAVLILLCVQVGSAQDKTMKFGIHASPGVSWFKPETRGIDNKGAGFAFEFGAMADIQLTENIAFSTGLGGEILSGKLQFNEVVTPLYHQDSKKSLDSATYFENAAYNMKYVKIPFTFKGKTNQIGYMTYFLEFGGALGINYAAEMDISNPNSDYNVIETEDILINKDNRKHVRPYRFSMVIRGGVEYNVSGNTSLVIGATFDNGLVNTFRVNKDNEEDNGFEVYKKGADKLPVKENGEYQGGGEFNSITNSITINLGVLF